MGKILKPAPNRKKLGSITDTTGSDLNVSEFDSKKAILFFKKTDKVMAALIKKVGPCKLEPEIWHSPYHALLRSIVFQQLSGKAATSILNKVLALYSHRKKLIAEEVRDTPLEALRSAGLSRAKSLAIQDLSRKSIEGLVPTLRETKNMTNAEIIERLVQVRGIGPWTVEMLLIFHLGRPDILPVTDYGVRKGFALTYKKKKLPTPKELAAFGERWSPYRSVAAWYLWRSLDLPVKKIKPSNKELL